MYMFEQYFAILQVVMSQTIVGPGQVGTQLAVWLINSEVHK